MYSGKREEWGTFCGFQCSFCGPAAPGVARLSLSCKLFSQYWVKAVILRVFVKRGDARCGGLTAMLSKCNE